MRRRLAATYVLLLILVLAALEIPLATTMATRDTQQVTLDRLADAVRFATVVEPELRTGIEGRLRVELSRYEELYGSTVAVVNSDWKVVARSDLGFDVDDETVAPSISRSLAGEHVINGGVIWPWENEPLVVAAPVGTGGDILGAVVIVSPTHETRAGILATWLLLGVLGLLAVALAIGVAFWLAGWTLRPVARLDAAAHRITEGDYTVRVASDGPVELRRLTAAFNEMANAVNEALERQRAFVSQASHQMRNPLTALQLRVEALADEMPPEEWAAEHQRAMEETERLRRILDSLLTLARAERGHHQLEVVDAGQVAASRVAAWQPLAVSRGITLVHQLPDEPAPVQAVATALSQSLDAFIDNALKFVSEGGEVSVTVRPRDGGVEVSVDDTGPGMSPEHIKHAAERFWRAPGAQNIEGSGLGLPIARVLITASGGTMDLQPRQPHGLSARVWLPSPRDLEADNDIPTSVPGLGQNPNSGRALAHAGSGLRSGGR